MTSLRFLGSLGIYCLFLHSTFAAEPRLESLSYTSTALVGYLGDPSLGSAGIGMCQDHVWLESGTVYSNFGVDELDLISRWEVEPTTQQVRLKQVLNVGGVWCVTKRGDLLCAQVMESKYAGADAEPQSLALFQTSDGSSIWSLPLAEEEYFIDAAFTLDEKAILVVSQQQMQMSLRLVSSADGKVLRRHDFDGPEQRRRAHTMLNVRAGGVWLQRQDDRIFRFSPETLTPVEIPFPDVPYGLLIPRWDERFIAFQSQGQVEVHHFSGGKWLRVFEDSTPQDQGGGYPNGFLGVTFMPDGRTALVTQQQRIRKLDLTTGKVSPEVAGCFHSEAALAPDGKRILVAAHPGLSVRRLPSMEILSKPHTPQHSFPPVALLALPGGRLLASSDHEGIWIWDLPTRTAVAHLLSKDLLAPGCGLRSIALADHGRTLLAEEGRNFLRWTLPAPESLQPGKPLVIINPTPAFGAVGAEGDQLLNGRVFSNEDGSVIVTREAGRDEFTLHSGLGARTTTTFPGPSGSIHINQAGLSADGRVFFHEHPFDPIFYRVELPAGKTTKIAGESLFLPGDVSGKRFRFEPWGLIPATQKIVGKNDNRLCLLSTDPGMQPLHMQELPDGYELGLLRPQLTRHDTLFAQEVIRRSNQAHFIAIWELNQGRLLGMQRMPLDTVSTWTVSLDGKNLIAAHSNATLSIWDISKMTHTDSDSPFATKPAEAPKPAAPVLTNLKNTRQEGPGGSGDWTFSESGTASQEARLPEIGRLCVNDQPYTHKHWTLDSQSFLNRYFTASHDFSMHTRRGSGMPDAQLIPNSQFGRIAAGRISASEGRAGSVWVSRQIGNPAGQNTCFLTFTDTLQNLSTERVQAQIQFEVQFPSGTEKLIDSALQPLQIADDGMVQISPDSIWIAPVMTTESTAPIPLVIFRSLSATKTPRLRWIAAEHRLQILHDADLPPAEPRHLVHAVRMIDRVAGGSPLHFTVPEWRDAGLLMYHSESLRALNFAAFSAGDPDRLGIIMPNLANNSPSLRMTQDLLGAEWAQNRDGSLRGEHGASGVLQLLLGDEPMPYTGGDLFIVLDRDVEERSQPKYHLQSSDLERWVFFTRYRLLPFDNKPVSLLQDTLWNSTDKPQTRKLTYLSTFREPVTAIYAADGTPVVMQDGLPRAQTKGALIFECAGASRPCTLISFHEEGAALYPRISMPTPQLFKMEYEVSVPPKDYVEFVHGTAQRQAGSFSSLVEAFTGCMSLNRISKFGASNGSNVK